MAGSPDSVAAGGLASATYDSEVVSTDPFTALRFVYGMLLGVEDLETEQSYHRGKSRLHNAWCHREGVLHGLNVAFNQRRELQVDPGLALDAGGRELHLDTPVCLDVGRWYQAHKDDAGFEVVDTAGGGKRFDAHVVVRFRACLSRPVPAIADPCAGAETSTAYSRVSEVVETCLRPGRSRPQPPPRPPYHRLRVLFGLEDVAPEDADVVARRDAVLAMAVEDQPRGYLEAFRALAALDEIDLHPALTPEGDPATIFPEPDSTEVVLADVVGVEVAPAADGWAIADPLPDPDVTVRHSHVATATIQELLCGPLFRAPGPPPPGPGGLAGGHGGRAAARAGTGLAGPQIDRDTVRLGARQITLRATAALHRRSVRAEAFLVTAFDPGTGWSRLEVSRTRLNRPGTTVTVELAEEPGGSVVRIVACGTGPTPMLGTDLVPLAGSTDDPPGTVHDGRDFVHMLRRS
jgi:hypothetical protein